MANKFDEVIIPSPKRMRLNFDNSECNSNAESVHFPSDYSNCYEENRLNGGEMSTPLGSEDDLKKDSTIDSDNYGSDDDDNESVASTVSNISDLSILSDMSGKQWKPISSIIGSFSWLERQMLKGVNPRIVLSQITGENNSLPDSISDIALWRVIFNYLSEPPKRNPLPEVHSLNHVVKLIEESSKIMVLTGAGVSVSCGIPDFRSKDGVYARLAVDFPNLPDPQAMFDINFFRQDPRPFFKFAKEIYPGLFQPSPSHRFIKMIERHKKLLRNYTQNIDTLERVAGIKNVIECHGSFATATCTMCNHKCDSEKIKETIFEQKIPYCPECSPSAESDSEKGIMKPDIVFFGEGLPDTFHDAMANDKDECDLLIVIGSSLKVRPVALIPSSLPGKVPQVLINRERLPYMNFDVELLGDSDVIIDHLCRRLGGEWTEVCWRPNPLVDRTQPELINYSSDSEEGSSDDETDCEKSEETDSEPVKCQKINKRQIGGSEETSRHVSLDSSRDSGIGENSNNSSDSSAPTEGPSSPRPLLMTKPTLVIPDDAENSFFCVQKRRYVFPGAEVPEILTFPKSRED